MVAQQVQGDLINTAVLLAGRGGRASADGGRRQQRHDLRRSGWFGHGPGDGFIQVLHQ